MKRMIRVFAALGAALLFCLPASAVQEEYEGYLVKFSPEAPALLSQGGGTGFAVVDTLEQALEFPGEYVQYIEPNYVVELFDDPLPEELPDDPYYAEYQWGLEAIGGLAPWRQGMTGAGVKVGIVDSGVNASHEDLCRENIDGANFASDGANYWEDAYGHGTFVAGVIAAQTDNAAGLAGIAPDVQLRAYRTFTQKSTTMARVVSAIEQAVADGCRVINLSFGTTAKSAVLKECIRQAADAGVVLVAAVGNTGKTALQYPAAYPEVIGVGSVGRTMEVSSFSQRNESVFLTAPGEELPGLSHEDNSAYLLDVESASNRGTSFAAPMVTALAACAVGYAPEITAENVRMLLQTTAVDRGAEGYDTDYGYGTVDAAAFVEQLQRDYAIVYELSGGTLPEAAPVSYRVTDGDLALPVPARGGYTFTGWYTDPARTQKLETIPAGSVGDMTLYAGWELIPGALERGEDNTLSYTAPQPAVAVAAAYDTHGRMTGRTLFSVEEGQGVLDTALLPEGACVRVYLFTAEDMTPLCQPLE